MKCGALCSTSAKPMSESSRAYSLVLTMNERDYLAERFNRPLAGAPAGGGPRTFPSQPRLRFNA
jgi:hypothetical protein